MGMARDQPVIRRLMPDDAGEYRTLRLRALRDPPDAFTSSFEEEQLRPLAWAQARLRPEVEVGPVAVERREVPEHRGVHEHGEREGHSERPGA